MRSKPKRIVGGNKMKHNEFIPGKYYKIDRKILHFIRQEALKKDDEGNITYELFFTNKHEKIKSFKIKGEKYKITASEVVNPLSYDKDMVSGSDDSIYFTASDPLSPNWSDYSNNDPISNKENVVIKLPNSPNTTKRSRQDLEYLRLKLNPKSSRIPKRTTVKKKQNPSLNNVKVLKSSRIPKKATAKNMHDVIKYSPHQHIDLMMANPHEFKSNNSPKNSPLLPAFELHKLNELAKEKKKLSPVKMKPNRSSTLRLKLNTTRKLPKK